LALVEMDNRYIRSLLATWQIYATGSKINSEGDHSRNDKKQEQTAIKEENRYIDLPSGLSPPLRVQKIPAGSKAHQTCKHDHTHDDLFLHGLHPFVLLACLQ
jgi:hypothetical protein